MTDAADYRDLPAQRARGAPAVSLFSGGGGLDLGLERAGFSTRVAVEIEPYACETLCRNREARHLLPDGSAYLDACTVLERSVRDMSGAALLREAGLRRGEAAVLAGGPPCVTFSVAGRRLGLAHETGLLFEEYARLLRAVRPAALVYENVKGLMSAQDELGVPGAAFDKIRNSIAAEGYALAWRTVNMADYGVPQSRERVIILGLRGSKPPTFPEPTHRDPERPPTTRHEERLPWNDVRFALDGLGSADPPGTQQPRVPNHVARRHSEATVASFAATPQGKRHPRYKRDRLRWDRPSKVIRAQGKVKADGSGQKNSSHQALHPDEARQLTPRECARIQTFPDWYWLPRQFVNAYRIVGDAVPPSFAQIVGESLMADLRLAGFVLESGATETSPAAEPVRRAA
jgi:DNA (cytosine-5)-methyltransferase 1